jgi:hypothetical protein
MSKNVGKIDRLFRLILGALLVVAPFVTSIAMLQSSTGTAISVLLGLILIATSAVRFCPIYRVLGVQTCKI